MDTIDGDTRSTEAPDKAYTAMLRRHENHNRDRIVLDTHRL
jgi:hypothetical protein